ncbi:hypothetical protein BCR33DRAFT_725460 [Rhizoclosmatium globosum]|uniref:Uncharacterized protein n=1 Tax=Rhizoclosmatium globosum TaxID=329046 RepID=A0A1Y2AYN7_9FUNG|nr:hypothetical protein BCR33DRAFT_725460 [Rhizoclosmatium globosum]|eukprot:ORY27584.1 hypothetical protein BCR33DRAFT_725460 [Rhizoclosmatium globosum]
MSPLLLLLMISDACYNSSVLPGRAAAHDCEDCEAEQPASEAARMACNHPNP